MTRPVSQAYRTNYADIEWTQFPDRPKPVEVKSAAPAYISDIMDPTVHMANGKISTSKSEFRRWTRDAGCEEVGNSAFPKRDVAEMPRMGYDIKQAIDQLRGK